MFKHAWVLLLALFVAACAGDREMERDDDDAGRERGERVYSSDQLGRVQEVSQGRIVSLTPVEIDDSRFEPGTVIGAIAGGLAGRQLGGGSGRDIATIIGAVAGGYAGSRYGDRTATAEAAEIGVELDDGRTFTVLQEVDDDDVLRVGDRVRVEFDGDKAKVIAGDGQG